VKISRQLHLIQLHHRYMYRYFYHPCMSCRVDDDAACVACELTPTRSPSLNIPFHLHAMKTYINNEQICQGIGSCSSSSGRAAGAAKNACHRLAPEQRCGQESVSHQPSQHAHAVSARDDAHNACADAAGADAGARGGGSAA